MIKLEKVITYFYGCWFWFHFFKIIFMKTKFKFIIIAILCMGWSVLNAQTYINENSNKEKINTTETSDTTKASQNKQMSVQDTSKVYTCSMHPDVISNKPGKCPKCGMDLIVKGSSNNIGMDCMGMMHGKHKVWMYIAGGTMMVVMMTVMIFRFR